MPTWYIAFELSLPEDRKDGAAAAHKANGQPAVGKWHNLACFGAGGGLWTTPTDLARFGIAIMTNGEKGSGLIVEIFYSFAQAYGWIHN